MVEPGETKVKAEEGEEKKFPKFNKKKHHGKTAMHQDALNKTCQSYLGELNFQRLRTAQICT